MSSSNAVYQPDNTVYQPDLDAPTAAAPEPLLPAWKVELNAKLAAHRQRKDASGWPGVAEPETERRPSSSSRAAQVAARVAERYATAPTYSELLAASAKAAAAAAETAAFAARQAQEAAEALACFAAAGDWSGAESERAAETGRPGASVEAWPVATGHGSAATEVAESRPGRGLPGGEPWPFGVATVEHPEPLPPRGIVPARPAACVKDFATVQPGSGAGMVDALAEAMVPAAISLPAKLIEFPRELIAARKSRPRIAEGPLAQDLPDGIESAPSLRIFEVEGGSEESGSKERGLETGTNPMAEPIEAGTAAAMWEERLTEARESRHSIDALRGKSLPGRDASRGYRVGVQGVSAAKPEAETPEWQPIRLSEHPLGEQALREQAAEGLSAPALAGGRAEMPVLHTASLADRTMAALVDLVVVSGAFLLFLLVFAACTAHPPVTKAGMAGAAGVFMGMLLFYEWLFLRYGGGTPGMRYARIALCTFDDENLTRRMLERRVWASVLSGLPLGLGFLWVLFDEDALGWHDRMTRSYQRSYR